MEAYFEQNKKNYERERFEKILETTSRPNDIFMRYVLEEIAWLAAVTEHLDIWYMVVNVILVGVL